MPKPRIGTLFVIAITAAACAPRTVLTGTELRMTADEHDRAATVEEFHAKESAVYEGPDHAARAAEHRAVARRLRDEEASACAGLTEGTEGVSPFSGFTVERVERVEESWARAPAPGRALPTTLKGAEITVRSSLEFEAANRRLACSVARAAARGDDGTNPVGVGRVTVRIRPLADRLFQIRVRTEDEASAREVLRRAEALVVR